MQNTKIQWCDSTINGSSGCDGCELWTASNRTCYAGHMHQNRLAESLPALYAKDFSEVRMIPGRYQQAADWPDLTGKPRKDKPWLDGKPRHIFVGDMGDFLSKAVTDELLKRELFGAIASKNGSRHVWILLTKQIERLARMSISMGGLPDNVIAMTTVTNQRTEDVRVPWLNDVICKTKGLSIEPLLGPVDLYTGLKVCWSIPGGYQKKWYDYPPEHVTWTRQGLVAAGWKPGIHWVIAGGESGHGARPVHPNWIRFLRDQCVAMGVPFFFKQWGEHMNSTEANCHHDQRFVEIDGKDSTDWTIDRHGATTAMMSKVGKSKSGRLLDGREWNEMPSLKLTD